MLIRAFGPSLSAAGVSGGAGRSDTRLLPGLPVDPLERQLEIHQRDQLEITGIAPTNDKESALLVTPDPGSYTAVIRGKNNTAGVTLVEVYQMK